MMSLVGGDERSVVGLRPPVSVWLVTVLAALLGVVSIVGSFIFAFPLGGLLGFGIGVFLIALGIGYGVIAWRLRLGQRRIWLAAIALPIVHTSFLATEVVVREGSIPSEDYPFMAIALVMVLLLLLPVTRRFFGA